MDNAIVDELASHGSISYLELIDRVVKLRGKTMSFETFNFHLKKMLKENILKKDDKGRGKQVFYSLTEDAKKQRHLNILGVNPQQLLFRRIYEKLFFYEIFHTPLNIASSQVDFNKILAELKVDIKDLRIVYRDVWELEGALKRDEFSLVDTKTIYSVGISGISIVKTEFWEVKKYKNKKYATEYSFTLPGVSVDELIKNDSLGAKFSHADVEAAFKLLIENGLIKPGIVFRGQRRFVIADDRLLNLTMALKWIHNDEWRFLLHKWMSFDEPTREEKERMNWLLGEEEATRIFKKVEISRHEYKQIMKGKLINPNLSAQQYKRSLEQDLIKHKSQLDEKIKKAKINHRETIQEYTFLHDIIKIVCPMIIE
jgi:hypothetical protein